MPTDTPERPTTTNKTNLYTPASTLSSQKDIESSSYTTTPSRTPGNQTPPLSGQSSCYSIHPAKAAMSPTKEKKDTNYLYVPASSKSSRRDIEASSYTTTPSRTPGEQTPPLSGQSSIAASNMFGGDSTRNFGGDYTEGVTGHDNQHQHQHQHQKYGYGDHQHPSCHDDDRRRNWHMDAAAIDAALKGMQGGGDRQS